DAFCPGGDGDGAQIFQAQIEAAIEGRMDAADVRIAFLTASEGGDFGFRMAQEQLDQFQGRVAGGAEDCDANHELESDAVKPRTTRDWKHRGAPAAWVRATKISV